MAGDPSLSALSQHRPASRPKDNSFLAVADRISRPILFSLASLKVTVTLFAMGIFIILVGTLAQVDKDMWQVIDEYFRSWIARVNLQVFLPRSWAPNWQDVPGWTVDSQGRYYGFWFPGGAAIGAAMVVNLLAAHLVRFKTQATRGRILTGSIVILVGALITGYVISSGHNHGGLQGEPPFSWESLWVGVKLSMVAASIAAIYSAVSLRRKQPSRSVEVGLLGSTGTVLGILAIWAFIAGPNAYLGDSGMRILWQLIQATFCGLVLLAGCMLAFRRRGGVVLIHLGIGLMMFGQFYVAKYDVEEQMRIEEGQTKSYAEDIRRTELAIIDSSNPEEDKVVAIAGQRLTEQLDHTGAPSKESEADSTGVIKHPELPFNVQVVQYFKNAEIEEAKPDAKNLATAGFGKQFIAAPRKPSAGASSDGAVDLAAAYVRLIKKDGSGDLGTYLVSQIASLQDLMDKVEVDGKTYQIALRFQRSYKPYKIKLLDVRKDDYVGTSTPRNYSSDIHLVDAENGVDRSNIRIWMNNPLRYAGETFYQSGYIGPPDSAVEATTLSVVRNTGWMIPYVSCMIVMVGLAAHFLGTLVRFLRRPDAGETIMKWGAYGGFGIGIVGVVVSLLHRSGQRTQAAKAQPNKKREGAAKNETTKSDSFEPSLEPVTLSKAIGAFFPLIPVSICAVLLIAYLIPKRPSSSEMDLREFGRLPLIADGRVKPFDTLARNSLRIISNRETFRDANDKRQPAIRWLLDVITSPEKAEEHRVIRIDNLEVLDTLDLKRRKGNLYSVAEIRGGIEEFEKQVDQAQKASRDNAEGLTVYQRKLLELDRRIRAYTRVAAAFQPPSLPPFPTQNDSASIERFRDEFFAFLRSIDSIQPPLAVPMKMPSRDGSKEGEEQWQPYSKAWALAFLDLQLGNEPAPALTSMNKILVAYGQGKVDEFNNEVRQYHELLKRNPPNELAVKNTFWNRMVGRISGSFYRFEEGFNHLAPFYFAWWPYIGAAMLAAASWLFWRQPLAKASLYLASFAFIVHTFALVARIYISGRPPVTNLYSSAVFIGWGVVLFCLAWEWFYRNGLPVFLGSLLGFASLIVAHFLAGDGDTFTVLQAVLDTQFWLATHVVSVTLGYAATFLAGTIGIAYVLRGLFTPTLNREASREMARMMYGTTCFALFFSFFGTVLGGLWADDSWGRFWGWDPKENGALIIVLWNALVLHAYWDGMAKERGLAVLSVVGNIVTAWSWFGVNELGVGLHSYGFTEGVLRTLLIFGFSQIAVIVIGSLPKSIWWSFVVHGKPKSPEPSDTNLSGPVTPAPRSNPFVEQTSAAGGV